MTTANREDYLINILRLTEGEGNAKTSDLAKLLNVSPASVTEMLNILSKENLVTYVKYKGVSLTEAGLFEARRIRKKHHVLERFLINYLDVEHELAHEEACRMEHAISDDSTIKMCQVMGPCVDNDCESCSTHCSIKDPDIVPAVSMNTLDIGEEGVIEYLKDEVADNVKKLVSMGFVPGRKVKINSKVSEKGPRIIEIGDATLVLDHAIASSVYIRRSE